MSLQQKPNAFLRWIVSFVVALLFSNTYHFFPAYFPVAPATIPEGIFSHQVLWMFAFLVFWMVITSLVICPVGLIQVRYLLNLLFTAFFTAEIICLKWDLILEAFEFGSRYGIWMFTAAPIAMAVPIAFILITLTTFFSIFLR